MRKRKKKQTTYTREQIRAFRKGIVILLGAVIEDIIETHSFDTHLSSIVDYATVLISEFEGEKQ